MRCRAGTVKMLTDEVVPRIDGAEWPGIALCHACQRCAYFAGGFLKLLAKSLEKFGTGHYLARADTRTPQADGDA